MISSIERSKREKIVEDTGLDQYCRTDPLIYAGIKCYLAGDYEWEEVLLEIVKAQATYIADRLEMLKKFEMSTPVWTWPKED